MTLIGADYRAILPRSTTGTRRHLPANWLVASAWRTSSTKRRRLINCRHRGTEFIQREATEPHAHRASLRFATPLARILHPRGRPRGDVCALRGTTTYEEQPHTRLMPLLQALPSPPGRRRGSCSHTHF